MITEQSNSLAKQQNIHKQHTRKRPKHRQRSEPEIAISNMNKLEGSGKRQSRGKDRRVRARREKPKEVVRDKMDQIHKKRMVRIAKLCFSKTSQREHGRVEVKCRCRLTAAA